MTSIKTKALEWLNELCNLYYLNNAEKAIKDTHFYFLLEGFADEPEVFIKATSLGLEFGFEYTQWDGYMPSPIPGVRKKHSLSWEYLQKFSKEEQQGKIFELLMKTIIARKRRYRKCQFCGKETASEHRYDRDTCHNCASKHFGVVY